MCCWQVTTPFTHPLQMSMDGAPLSGPSTSSWLLTWVMWKRATKWGFWVCLSLPVNHLTVVSCCRLQGFLPSSSPNQQEECIFWWDRTEEARLVLCVLQECARLCSPWWRSPSWLSWLYPMDEVQHWQHELPNNARWCDCHCGSWPEGSSYLFSALQDADDGWVQPWCMHFA